MSGDPSARSGSVRLWFPILLLGLICTSLAALWTATPPEVERFYLVTGTWLVCIVGAFSFLVWLAFFSRVPGVTPLRTFIATVAALGLAFLSIRRIAFSGDMVPELHWRWSKTQDELVEQDRATGLPQALPAVDLTIEPDRDFPEYRGAARDGVVRHVKLARDWSSNPPQQLWRRPIGEGWAAFAVAGNVIVTIEQRRDQEAIVCYDQTTGAERWVHGYPARFEEPMGGPGPRATPTIADGKVYSLGATGSLRCLEGATGKLQWSVEILKGAQNLQWAMSGSPLVFDDLVVVNPGKSPIGSVVAFDHHTGKKLWGTGETAAGYSSPMRATIAGKRQIVLLDGDILAGYDPQTGVELWRFPWDKTNQKINVAQPIVLPDARVFITSGYGIGGCMIEVANVDGKWQAKELWRNKSMRCRFTSPVHHNGFLYGLDEGILVCVDARTGERKWKQGRYLNGQMLLVDDLLLITGENGEVALVEATPTAYRETSRIKVFADKTWNCPAMAGDLLFLRNHREMAAYRCRCNSPG